MAFNLSHFVGKAFVSFQYQHYRDYFLEYFKDASQLKIADAPLKASSFGKWAKSDATFKTP